MHGHKALLRIDNTKDMLQYLIGYTVLGITADFIKVGGKNLPSTKEGQELRIFTVEEFMEYTENSTECNFC